MIDVENKLSSVLQALVTTGVRARVEKLAELEERSLSDMTRILIEHSLNMWEKSAPGRRRRK
jgi:hypothetical protein